MRIGGINQTEMIARYQNTINVSAPKAERAVAIRDSVELSEGAQQYATLMKQAHTQLDEADTAEESRVQEIAARINAGDYHVAASAVADGILTGVSMGTNEGEHV